MTHMELNVLLASVCYEFNVGLPEIRRRAEKNERQGQHAVSLARYTFVWRAWRAGAESYEVAIALGMHERSVRHWFADFRSRARPGQKGRAA